MKRVDVSCAGREPLAGHTSKGDQPKWRVREYWYKADHMGCEALSEVLVSGLLGFSSIPEYVRYAPVWVYEDLREYRACESRNLLKREESLIPLERLHRAYAGRGLAEALGKIPSAEERIQYTVDFVESKTNLTGFGEYITLLLELDAFTLNEDRHTNNIAVIRNENTLEFRLCPVFDNGLAFLSDLNDYPREADPYGCMERVRAKPFSVSFEEQMAAAEALYGNHLKFSFLRSDVRAILNSMAELYDDGLLTRVQTVVYEQMRKYPIFFDR